MSYPDSVKLYGLVVAGPTTSCANVVERSWFTISSTDEVKAMIEAGVECKEVDGNRERETALASITECATQVYKNHSVETAIANKPTVVNDDFITQTVYGFLDFTTTIGNTVMVFSPQSAPGDSEKAKKSSDSVIQTKPSETKEKVAPAIQPSKTHKINSEDETKKQTKGTKVVVNSVIEQNVINSTEDNGLQPLKNQVR
ncbi:hypothetical protein WN48_09162 [Eufriesea mexicana]|nr:hypothetical protein WN48_09162 [Eufriesea mexicana]